MAIALQENLQLLHIEVDVKMTDIHSHASISNDRKRLEFCI